MAEDEQVGTKYLWVAQGGILEMHGQEKHSWTYLEDHLVRNGIAADNLTWIQDKQSDTLVGNRMIFQVLSAEGDLQDIYHVDNGTENFDDLSDFLRDHVEPDNIVIFFTDFVFFLSDAFFNVLKPYGINATNNIDSDQLLQTENDKRHSQIAGLFNTQGQADMASISPDADGTFHHG